MFSRRMIAVVAMCVCSVLARADWPDWRGPGQDGRSDAALPLHWSETENVAWKTAIHDVGHSTPVVLGDQIWTTTATTDGTVLYAVAVDVKSGRIVHDIPVFEIAGPQRINPLNTHATPSAALEKGRVYVHYGSAGTACLDTSTGEVLWRRTDLNCDHMQGPASSPVLFEDLLVLTIEGTDKQFMAALNKKTGDTVWRYDRPRELYDGIEGVYVKSYQTPVIVDVNGRPQLISNGAVMVTGHDPRTGAEVWRARYRDDSTISRIVAGHGLLFVNTGGAPNATQLWAIRAGGAGDVTDSHVVWKMTKDVPHESSPVLVGDLLYTMSEGGVLMCIEAASGATVWSQRLNGDFWASLLAARDRIYLPDKKGRTTVFAAGREYRELAVNALDGEIFASPAVAGNSLLLRTKTHLYRIAGQK
ncbi:MAG: quinonprotein alcohol dehydrogenase [Candidatus Hydrogenedentes bacterium]|nr:quinonprotein alcohol dehydrogenase [Candidatus Hydrogenedentota bacterium]